MKKSDICLRDSDTGAFFRMFIGLHIYSLTETVKDSEQLQELCNFQLNHTHISLCISMLAGALWLWSLLTICKRWANSKLFTLLVFVCIGFVCECRRTWTVILYTATAQFEMTAAEIELEKKIVEFVPFFSSACSQVEMRLCRRMFITHVTSFQCSGSNFI